MSGFADTEVSTNVVVDHGDYDIMLVVSYIRKGAL